MSNLVKTKNTVSDLTTLTNDAIANYKKTADKYTDIAEKVLDEITQENVIQSMEVSELFKLLEITNKHQLAPIAEFTKLIQNLTNLMDRQDIEAEKEKLFDFTKELEKAKQTSTEAKSINDFKDEIIIEAEVE